MVTYRTKGGHFFLSSSLSNIFSKISCIFQKKSVILHKISCARQFENKLSLRSLA